MCSTCVYWPHGLLIDNDINFLVICWTFQSVFGLTVIGWTLNIPVIYGLTVINWTFQFMVNFSGSSHLLDFPVIWLTCRSFVGLSVICYNFEGSSHLLFVPVICWIFQSFIKLESVPDPDHKFRGLPKDRNPRVYLKYMSFHQYLTDKRFDLVETMEEADIIFIQRHFKDYE